jgi:hypothetical protein
MSPTSWKEAMLKRFSICAALIAFGTLSFAANSHTRDNGRYRQLSRDIKAWIERLTDQEGTSCCAIADGVRPMKFSWDIGKNRYRVKVDGQWLVVPDSAVIMGPNRLGHAVVWVYYELDLERDIHATHVRCL